MKKYFFMAVAAIAALSSCSNNDEFEQTQIGNQCLVFTATMEGSEVTRATYDATNKYALWEVGDMISINGVSYSATPDGTDATKATFTKVSEASNPTPTYKAYFPASLYDGTTATLPATQTYTVGKFNMPMYAESETTTLSFKNICAVLAITVTSADIPTLKSIKVASDQKMNGTFTVNSTTDGGYKAVIGTDGSKEVVLSMGETPIDPTTDGTTFYIAIPAQEYSYLKIYLSEDGTLYKRAMITKKASGLGEIARNTIYNIAYETNAVQMYAGGLYWSTMNIGASSETEAGTYFAWGDVEGQTWSGLVWSGSGFSSAPSIDNPTLLPLDYDAAYKKWGSSWCMPLSAHFQALKNATYWKWEDGGYYVYAPQSGDAGKKNNETSNTYNKSDALLFFPAAGRGKGTELENAGSNGYYWSSTRYSQSPVTAYDLFFTSGTVNTESNFSRHYGFSVRPVSDY